MELRYRMKKATCKQLAGACDQIIIGNTPEEMAEHSRKHGMSMAKDPAHKAAMQATMQLSNDQQQSWYQKFVDSFKSLEDL